jgi:hypothetical protein
MQPIIVGILGWGSTPNNVRIGWQLTGAPGFKITDNKVFITATPVDHQINRQHDIIVENSSPGVNLSTGFTRVMALNVIAYGENAMTNIQAIKLGMFHQSVRMTLALEDIYYIPDSAEPRRVPELFQIQWWERADMELRFNELLTDDQAVNEIDSVDVTIDEENGATTEFTINQ